MMKQAEQLGSALAAQTDAVISRAISIYLDTETWCLDAIAHMMVRHVHHDGREIYYFGGTAIAEFFPVELQNSELDGSFKITATRKYRILVEPYNLTFQSPASTAATR